MEFENSVQSALKTLRASITRHEAHKKGYEKTIVRLLELQKTVPPQSKVKMGWSCRSSQLPLGEIIGILRRTLAIDDFHVLLDLDLRIPLSTFQVVDIIRKAIAKIESQIEEIHKEISDAESLSILQGGDREVLNEEGLPIRDIREDVGDDEEPTRAVLAEDQQTKIFSMEEIDKMMDEAMEQEQAELEKLQPKSNLKDRKMKEEKMKQGKLEKETMERAEERITAVAGEGLEIGQVNGEELLAKLVDDSKNRYNPIEDIWMEDEDEDDYSDGDVGSEEDDEQEEDQYGRTRGYLIPPNIGRGVKQERGVKFASFEKPATPLIGSSDGPVKSAMKKNLSASTTNPSVVPLTSTRIVSVMADSIVERAPSQVTPNSIEGNSRIPPNRMATPLAK